MPFEKGKSGNPSGRPKGTGQVARLRESIQSELPDIIQSVVDAAKDGDLTAAKILLDRTVPILRAVDVPVTFPHSDGLADMGAGVLEAVSSAGVTPEQADRLLSVLGKQARVVEVDELTRRVEALEAADG